MFRIYFSIGPYLKKIRVPATAQSKKLHIYLYAPTSPWPFSSYRYHNVMEAAIAHMETVILKEEERAEIAEDTFMSQKARRPILQEDISSQTSLF